MADPFTFAEDAVKETQGIYNRGNRPNWARGAIGATLFTFKQFSVAYVEFLKRLPPKQRALASPSSCSRPACRGCPSRTTSTTSSTRSPRRSGTRGTRSSRSANGSPACSGDDFAGFLMFGGSALPGVPLDVQGRLGLGNLIPGDRHLQAQRAGQDAGSHRGARAGRGLREIARAGRPEGPRRRLGRRRG
jgi:hypothetical protein